LRRFSGIGNSRNPPRHAVAILTYALDAYSGDLPSFQASKQPSEAPAVQLADRRYDRGAKPGVLDQFAGAEEEVARVCGDREHKRLGAGLQRRVWSGGDRRADRAQLAQYLEQESFDAGDGLAGAHPRESIFFACATRSALGCRGEVGSSSHSNPSGGRAPRCWDFHARQREGSSRLSG
jgi:hypothetical protein